MKRNITISLILINVISLAFGATENASSQKNTGDSMEREYKQIDACIKIITKPREIDNFVYIGSSIDNFSISNTKEGSEKWLAWRKNKTQLWLSALNILDQYMDYSFDPANVPQMNISPSSMHALDSGIDPNEIEDEVVKKQYEQAIEVNARKLEWYAFQKELRELDKAWHSKLITHVKFQYSGNQTDVNEVSTLINLYISNKKRSKLLIDEISNINKP